MQKWYRANIKRRPFDEEVAFKEIVGRIKTTEPRTGR